MAQSGLPCGPSIRPPSPSRQEDAYYGTCSVSGSSPAWLRGTLYRVGPGLWEVGERQLRHLVDGYEPVRISSCIDEYFHV